MHDDTAVTAHWRPGSLGSAETRRHSVVRWHCPYDRGVRGRHFQATTLPRSGRTNVCVGAVRSRAPSPNAQPIGASLPQLSTPGQRSPWQATGSPSPPRPRHVARPRRFQDSPKKYPAPNPGTWELMAAHSDSVVNVASQT